MVVDASDMGSGQSSHRGTLWVESGIHVPTSANTAEHNCDVGNHKLLALVMALKEWCHCLQGATEPSLFGLTTVP